VVYPSGAPCRNRVGYIGGGGLVPFFWNLGVLFAVFFRLSCVGDDVW